MGTREIAAKAGVNATLINRYFGSKKKLFAAVVNSLTELAKAPGPNVRASLDQALDCIVLAEEPTTWVEEFRVILFPPSIPKLQTLFLIFLSKNVRHSRSVWRGRIRAPKQTLHSLFSWVQLWC